MSASDRERSILLIARIVSAVFLLAAGGIHLFLVVNGTGGILGVMFVLNFVAGAVLGIGMLVVPARFLLGVTVLGLLFMIASLAALLLALTVGLFGIRSSWEYLLAPETVILESIGVVVLAVATVIVFRHRRAELELSR
ncbi:hypothetical protein LG299_05055 [Microbacterium lacus]|uniref:hypothetical protein n=1 Tax=Microbacterium lacus TaxID=415217 RepID=UPI00384FD320